MMTRLFTLIIFLALVRFSYGSVPHDKCEEARILTNLDNWCSDSAAFTTVGAVDEGVAPATCFPQETQRDVWFIFTSRGTNISIQVVGDTRLGKGGSLRSPQMAIYTGSCGVLTQVACISDNRAPSNNVVQILSSSMQVGQKYYVRVSARGTNSGTFKLCVNSYTSSGSPSGDCQSAVILCDDRPFTVSSVRDRGAVLDNINDAFCTDNLGGRAPVIEEQSTWYKWTIQTAGSLTFTITPSNPSDDLDWVLYELTALNNCSNKKMLRYSIVGENVGEPTNRWIACTGATGLREGETDEIENCGCNNGANSFVKPAIMEVGKSYALVIINYSQTGFGYELKFGGTSKFKGPQVNFITDVSEACVGSPIVFSDNSTTPGSIRSWNWSFGPAARIQNNLGKGPHSVVFDQPGTTPVLLRVTSAEGCSVSKVVDIKINCCSDHFKTNTRVSDITCPDTETGKIDLGISNDYSPYVYRWNDGKTEGSRTGLATGNYTVTVVDKTTCSTSLAFFVNSPKKIDIVPELKMPTCNGGLDGSIRLKVAGATAPYQYSWNNASFNTQNLLSGLPVGNYKIQVKDANQCLFDTTLNLKELELILDPSVESIIPPRCFGFSDGKIEVNIDNGNAPYEYDWKDSKGFQSANSLANIKAGKYEVQVRDKNRCLGNFSFSVNDFPPLSVNLSPINVSCNGLKDGSIQANGLGGNGNYVFRWQSGERDPFIKDLGVGNYGLTIFDRNGCKLDTFQQIFEPTSLQIGTIQIIDNLCFGFKAGSIASIGSGGTPPYSYAIDVGSFQTQNNFKNLAAGDYILRISDVLGCTVQQKVTVKQPGKLTVFAGLDTLVNLGTYFQLTAMANQSPVLYKWIPQDLVVCSTCSSTRTKERVNSQIVYKVQVTNPDGCVAEDDISIEVAKNRPVFIPSAFSPNNDGVNDFFTAFANESAKFIKDLTIYDRYGGIIYKVENIKINDETSGWNGTDSKGTALNTGVYLYTVTILFIDETALSFSGNLHLMR
jgi:gliding motility-associated-like protein